MKRLIIIIVCVFAILASGCSGKKQSNDQSGGTNTVGQNDSEPTKSGTAETGMTAPSRVSKVVYSTREYTTNGTTSHYQIYMLTGTNPVPVRLTNNANDNKRPVWSPDGAYVAYVAGKGDICVMNPVTGTLRKFASVANIIPETFCWPDKGHLIYATRNARGAVTCWLLALSAETASSPVQVGGLTNNATISTDDIINGRVSVAPNGNVARLSPDGRQIICTQPNGTQTGAVTLSVPGKVTLGPWSPKMNSLIINMESGLTSQPATIGVLDLQSGAVRNIAQGDSAVWSADGSHILYRTAEVAGELVDSGRTIHPLTSDICVVSVNGGMAKKLTTKTCRSDSVNVMAIEDATGAADFGLVAGAITTTPTATDPLLAASATGTTTPVGTTAPTGATTTTSPTGADLTATTTTTAATTTDASGVQVLGGFEAVGGFIKLKSSGTGKGVVVGTKNGNTFELQDYSLQGGKYVASSTAPGNANDESRFEDKYGKTLGSPLSDAESMKTVSHDLPATTKVLKAFEVKNRRVVMCLNSAGGKWEIFAAVYAKQGNDWKQSGTLSFASSSGKAPSTVNTNAWLKDVDGDGRPELFLTSNFNTDKLHEVLKIIRIGSN